MSILLTVGSIILVSVLPGDGAGDYNAKTIADTQKLERVEEAMRSFMATNLRRPCPANGSYAVDSANFGTEAANPGSCTGGTPAVQMGPDTGTGYIVSGVIPTRSLGLPDDFMFDSYGRRFTYVVDTRATSAAKCQVLENIFPGSPTPSGTGDLIIKDASGNVLDAVMYAYIHHGPSGYGAFPEQGSTAAGRLFSGSTDTNEMTNAGVDSTCLSGHSDFGNCTNTDFTNVRVQNTPILPFASGGNLDTGFDNILYYRNDIKNTCCLGPTCPPPGFRMDGASAGDYSGISTAVGDINNDGIPDLFIGAPGRNGDTGAVYVVFGTKSGFPDPLPLSSLNGSNGFVLNGAAAGSWTGWYVAAGDVNGDGIQDIVIGNTNPSVTTSNSVDVVFGGTTMASGTAWTSCPCTLNTGGTVINGTNGFQITGTAATADGFGGRMALGDINKDGKADILVSAGWASPGGRTNAGSVYVIFGASSGWSSTQTASSLMNGTKGVEFDGQSANDQAFSVAAGDVNGDGYADIIIGAPHYSPDGTVAHQEGTVYVIYGKSGAWTSPQTLNATFINGSNGVQFNAPAYGYQAGFSVAAGDINGDGYADIVTSAPAAGASNNSAIYVIFGKGAGWASPQTLNSTFFNGANGMELDGPAANAYLGEYNNSLTAGDVNGDGFADIGITAINNSKAYIVFGKKCGGSSFSACSTPNTLSAGPSSFLNGTNGVELDGVGSTNAGASISFGNILGGSIGNIIIGADFASPSEGSQAGSTYLYYGKKSGWPTSAYTVSNLCTGTGC